MNAKPKLTDAMRAYLSEAGRKGGKRGSSEDKRRAAQIRHARARVQKQSQAELLAISREIGSFLDGLTLSGADEDKRKELCDRLYSILQVAKIKVRT